MRKWKSRDARRREDWREQLKIAEIELAPLLEDVRRDRDRLAATSLTLRFVWQVAEHPSPGNLWKVGYGILSDGYWSVIGHDFGRLLLPIFSGLEPYECSVFLINGDENVYSRFTQHCREAEAIFGRMAGDGTRFNWANVLFETFSDAVDEGGQCAVEWHENEKPDCPETTWSNIADLSDVLAWTQLLLKTFRDRAVLRQQSPDGSLPEDDQTGTSGRRVQRPDGSLSPKLEIVKATYEWAISKIPGADKMTIPKLFHAIQTHSDMKSEYLDSLPDNAETFGTYLRRAGIRRYSDAGERTYRQSRRPRS